MRSSLFLLGTVFVSGAVGLAACGSDGGVSEFGDPLPPLESDADVPDLPDGCGFGCDDAASGDASDVDGSSGSVTITSMRIDPADATLTIDAGQAKTQSFRVYAKLNGSSLERDITKYAVFYVPDNYLVGAFPTDGKPTFTTRVPAAPTDPPQRGGKVTIRAQASNSDGTVATVTTSLTVKVSPITMTQPGATLPTNPAGKFTTADPNAARKPAIAYPNDGVMLPPNLRRLDVHWDAGATNTLFELRFTGDNTTVTYYARCGGGTGFLAGKCGFELDQQAYAWIAESNAGGQVKLVIRGTTDAGGTYGESSPITLSFAEQNVEGGLYYWAVVPNQIGKVMRVDFGNPNGAPEDFIVPPEPRLDGSVDCVGCHTLSRDGKKLVASVGGRWDGRLVYIGDVGKPKSATDWATQTGAPSGAPAKNRLQFASFNPDGSKFVAVYGDVGNVGKEAWLADNQLLPFPNGELPDDMNPKNLFFHDGTTGLRTSKKTLTFKPNHPDWSPDGTMIAVTHVGNDQTATQRPTRSGIDVLRQENGQWLDPVSVVPAQIGKNRVNPNFVPDSSFFLYSESTCPADDPDSDDCDGDSDPSSEIFAIKPVPSQGPVALKNVGTAGVADGAGAKTGDTFPRSAPFKTKHKDGTLVWATIASRRAPGYRTKDGAQLLWMFAIDPAKVLAGQDGSYKAFFLPFQAFETSNHIAQWTEKIVGGNAPPPEPPPAEPLPPPATPIN